MPTPLRLAIFASGSGSNAEAIATHLAAHPAVRPALVVANVPGAGVLERAGRLGLPAIVTQEKNPGEQELLGILVEHSIDFIALAGWLRRLPPAVVARYAQRVVNVHPALLPAFGGTGMYGAHVHRAVLAAGAAESGITIHYVNEAYDEGAIIAQVRCPVLATDTPEALATRVLALEHAHYPRIIGALCQAIVDKQANFGQKTDG